MAVHRRLPGGRALRQALALVACGALSAIGSSAAHAENVVFTPITLPTISGKAAEGEVLTEVPARWSEQPASSTLQWQRCDAKGNGCQSIAKATGSTYRLTAADVGSTLRVTENARNSAGAVTPDVSEPTATVQGRATGGGSPGGGGSSNERGGRGERGGSNRPGSPSGPSSAELERLLAHQLTPSGKAASLVALRRNGDLRMHVELPRAGTLTLRWYVLQPVHRHGREMRKRTLIADARATLAASSATTIRLQLTSRGRQLVKHARRLRVQATASFAVGSGATVTATVVFALHA